MWESCTYQDGCELESFNSVTPQQCNHFKEKDSFLISWFIYLLALLQRKHFIPDTAIEFFLRLLSVLFAALARLYPALVAFVTIFPRSLYQMRRFLKLEKNSFVRYVTCPKCSEICKCEDCVEIKGTKRMSKPCSICGAKLLKTVHMANKQELLYPIRTYSYRSLRSSLQLLLDRPNFYLDCEHWKNRKQKDNSFSDVYDGAIWQEFQSYGGKPFLSESYTFGLMINVDWFKVYKHTEYSMGAIYLSVMNLPRSLRFRQENMILIGLIPGPKEPRLNINPFLSPLVDELLEFIDGIPLNVSSQSSPKIIRCLLLCVACDMPASRKVVGFMGHAANFGCNKCLKKFPGGFGQKDYSGFERSQWKMRSNEEHRQNVAQISKCKGKSACLKLESELGCRYSVLLKLPYFDPIRMTVLDPMHNLYLGTAKHVLKRIWLGQGMINHKQFESIQDCVDSVHVPRSIGRIPSKIASSFSGFTADQFKNWTNIYSLFALYNILPSEDFECWKHFVLASRILNQMEVSKSDIQLVDALLMQFCKRTERMYGKEVITPNLHMHCHLKQSMLDFGPIYGFWLFSFERYNGIIESFSRNSSSIEVQCMQRFIYEFSISTANLPRNYESEFSALVADVEPMIQGSVKSTLQPLRSEALPLQHLENWTQPANVVLPKSSVLAAMDQSFLPDIRSLYEFLYPHFVFSDSINSTYYKYSQVEYNGITYKSECKRPDQLSILLVQKYHPSNTSNPRPAAVRVHYFLKHAFTYQEQQYEHILLCVSWLRQHSAADTFGKPLQIWWKDLFESNLFTFIPIQYILSECAFMDIHYEEQTVLLLCPVKNF